jgi:hypothetical protein
VWLAKQQCLLLSLVIGFVEAFKDEVAKALRLERLRSLPDAELRLEKGLRTTRSATPCFNLAHCLAPAVGAKQVVGVRNQAPTQGNR